MIRFPLMASKRAVTLQSQLSSRKHFSTSSNTPRLEAAVLDWSGTCADIFVIAPADAFVQVFAKHGVPITMAEARQPMGLRKDLHIEALTQMPEIAKRWEKRHGKLPGKQEVDAMFKDFIPLQLQCLPQYTGLIDGTVKAVNDLRGLGMKIGEQNLLCVGRLINEFACGTGNSTGFQRVMVDILLADAAKQGYVPDCSVAGDEVTRPRPFPYMVHNNMQKLDIKSAHCVVKVDDTVGGIGEGINAGAWTVALYETSNYMDIDSMEQWNAMDAAEKEVRAQKAKAILLDSGAHYVVRSIKDLPRVCESINLRLEVGERPQTATTAKQVLNPATSAQATF